MLIGIFYSQIVESSSLVSVLFREAISHPYISFFHLLVNGFSVTCNNNNNNNNFQDLFLSQFRQDFSALCAQLLLSIGSYFLEVCAFGTLITSAEVFRLILCKII